MPSWKLERYKGMRQISGGVMCIAVYINTPSREI